MNGRPTFYWRSKVKGEGVAIIKLDAGEGEVITDITCCFRYNISSWKSQDQLSKYFSVGIY